MNNDIVYTINPEKTILHMIAEISFSIGSKQLILKNIEALSKYNQGWFKACLTFVLTFIIPNGNRSKPTHFGNPLYLNNHFEAAKLSYKRTGIIEI